MTRGIARETWAEPIAKADAARRAGGRRGYNARRQWQATRRRAELSRLLYESGWPRRGAQAALAQALGVSAATVSRDIRALDRLVQPCPTCGQPPRFAPLSEAPAGAETEADRP